MLTIKQATALDATIRWGRAARLADTAYAARLAGDVPKALRAEGLSTRALEHGNRRMFWGGADKALRPGAGLKTLGMEPERRTMSAVEPGLSSYQGVERRKQVAPGIFVGGQRP